MSKLSTTLGRSGNPALTSEVFSKSISSYGETMTLQGTVNKTAFSLFLLIAAGSFTFSPDYSWLIWPGFIGGFIVAMITIFKKTWAPVTVPIYAVLEGLALGGISYMYKEAFYPGIVSQAILLTVSIFAALLFAYKTRIIKPTENFKLGVFAATGGIFLVYIASLIMSFFGASMPIMDPSNASLLSIGFSLFVVVIASLNLVLDFDFIEEGAEKGAPKYMEWYGAFGLLVTLVWLYLEILRLLAKLNSRR
ncbi:MAG: hypothetical protein CMP69_02035 [Flavobacteriales bacterium]|nr:hypothetical protein [Flavobacteriales bacterium]|tara:strand:- start:1346 stop:2095 length:750 start_codon:yes stop_codon:yes gene_type:complete